MVLRFRSDIGQAMCDDTLCITRFSAWCIYMSYKNAAHAQNWDDETCAKTATVPNPLECEPIVCKSANDPPSLSHLDLTTSKQKRRNNLWGGRDKQNWVVASIGSYAANPLFACPLRALSGNTRRDYFVRMHRIRSVQWGFVFKLVRGADGLLFEVFGIEAM